jgi:RNAse (barnase) inhibitor barstar
MWNTVEETLQLPQRIVIRIPAGVRSKRTLFRLFASKLRFPRYFGWNWDAFEECLLDLTWIPEDVAIVVVQVEPPFGATENRATFWAILEKWQQHSTRRVFLVQAE